MKFDEKTGKEVPENRTDEVKLSHKRLQKVRDESSGICSKEFEMVWLLTDINISLGIIVDMLGAMLNMQIKADKCIKKEVNEAYDERTDKPS